MFAAVWSMLFVTVVVSMRQAPEFGLPGTACDGRPVVRVCASSSCRGSRNNPIPRNAQYFSGGRFSRTGCCAFGLGRCDLCCNPNTPPLSSAPLDLLLGLPGANTRFGREEIDAEAAEPGLIALMAEQISLSPTIAFAVALAVGVAVFAGAVYCITKRSKRVEAEESFETVDM